VLRVVAVLAAALSLAASASATTPAEHVATQLKGQLAASMKTRYPTLKVTFTKVTCAIAKTGKSGRCAAYFQIPAARAIGTFAIGLTINPSTGKYTWKQISAACKDSKTGQKLACF
jgi:hypothetical protein